LPTWQRIVPRITRWWRWTIKTGFDGAGGVSGSSVRWHRRLKQGGGEAKMAFDTCGGSGNGREGGSSICVGGGVGVDGSSVDGGGGDGGSGRGGRRR
jgi:hypothetical protein